MEDTIPKIKIRDSILKKEDKNKIIVHSKDKKKKQRYSLLWRDESFRFD
jgi:hypothetical protein